jgi:hypothetical protein
MVTSVAEKLKPVFSAYALLLTRLIKLVESKICLKIFNSFPYDFHWQYFKALNYSALMKIFFIAKHLFYT